MAFSDSEMAAQRYLDRYLPIGLIRAWGPGRAGLPAFQKAKTPLDQAFPGAARCRFFRPGLPAGLSPSVRGGACSAFQAS